MSRKEKAKMARRDAMRSHPAGKGRGGDLDFGAVMAAIGRKPVIDPFARKGAC